MNRIKIQVILLILQLETDYFSSYSFQKCSIQSSGTTVLTETSRTAILHEEVLQDSSAPILHGYPYTIHPHTTYTCILQSREFSIQNPILHAEDKELFEYYYYYYYIQRVKRPSFQKRNSTHRRQGDLLIHPCVLQDLPRHSRHSRHSSFQSFQTFQLFQTFQSFMTFQPSRQFYKLQYLPGIHPITAFSNQNAYFTYSTNSTVRLVSTENSTEYQLNKYRRFTDITFFKEREML